MASSSVVSCKEVGVEVLYWCGVHFKQRIMRHSRHLELESDASLCSKYWQSPARHSPRRQCLQATLRGNRKLQHRHFRTGDPRSLSFRQGFCREWLASYHTNPQSSYMMSSQQSYLSGLLSKGSVARNGVIPSCAFSHKAAL